MVDFEVEAGALNLQRLLLQQVLLLKQEHKSLYKRLGFLLFKTLPQRLLTQFFMLLKRLNSMYLVLSLLALFQQHSYLLTQLVVFISLMNTVKVFNSQM